MWQPVHVPVYGRTCEARGADAGAQRGWGQQAGGDAGGSVHTSLRVRDTGVAHVLAELPGPAGGADTLRYTGKGNTLFCLPFTPRVAVHRHFV